jgi:branched-subunit amino acid transport protein
MRKQLLPLGLILFTAMALAPLLRDFIREFVVIPLLFAFWIGQIIFEAIPQAAFWSCFLGVALLLAGATLFRPGKTRSQIHEAETIQRGRVETWANLIRQAPQEDYYQWRLAQPLRELILETLAYEARLSPKEIKQRLLDDQLDLPPEIRAYLQASLKSLTYLPAPRFLFGSRRPASSLALNPEVLLKFLEDSASHPVGDRSYDA